MRRPRAAVPFSSTSSDGPARPRRAQPTPRTARPSGRRLAGILALALASALPSCGSMGPRTVQRDRADYGSAIGQSWKEQTLLNIVRLRYLDTPVFLDVSQVIAGYTVESNLSGGINFVPGADTGALGAVGKFTDRPTVTYLPRAGADHVRDLIRPLPPSALFFMLQAGWPADLVLRTGVTAVNGLRNRAGIGAHVHPGDPDFTRVVDLLTTLQRSSVVGMRVAGTADKGEAVVLFFHRDQTVVGETSELGQLLHLGTGNEHRVVYGHLASQPGEIAVETRSVLQALLELSSGVDVPKEDVAEGRVLPALQGDAEHCMLTVHSGSSAPSDALVAVPYRGHWFWIDDRDLRSKRTFAYLILLLSIGASDNGTGVPLVTVPA